MNFWLRGYELRARHVNCELAGTEAVRVLLQRIKFNVVLLLSGQDGWGFNSVVLLLR